MDNEFYLSEISKKLTIIKEILALIALMIIMGFVLILD